ncbi:hypothetical protein HG530_014819 [Fusarium avenaceum]|nr:hypothetical protein HG530_014819 [Fusarium avenaceum]
MIDSPLQSLKDAGHGADAIFINHLDGIDPAGFGYAVGLATNYTSNMCPMAKLICIRRAGDEIGTPESAASKLLVCAGAVEILRDAGETPGGILLRDKSTFRMQAQAWGSNSRNIYNSILLDVVNLITWVNTLLALAYGWNTHQIRISNGLELRWGNLGDVALEPIEVDIIHDALLSLASRLLVDDLFMLCLSAGGNAGFVFYDVAIWDDEFGLNIDILDFCLAKRQINEFGKKEKRDEELHIHSGCKQGKMSE